MLTGISKIHFIGIGGAGMSALACVLLEQGLQVTGSDLKPSKTSAWLESKGAKIHFGHDAANLGDAEAIVVSTAIHPGNPEVEAALAKGLKKLHRSDVNAYLLNRASGIAVAGAHGKTTTTSMIGLVLKSGGLDPTIIIGGEVDYLNGNAALGQGKYLVSEADESDGSFLSLRPAIAIVTNVENDHMDHYGTMENIRKAFREFLENLDEETGVGIVCNDNENIRMIIKDIKRKIITYGIDGKADYNAANIVTERNATYFDLLKDGELLVKVELAVPGRHNVLNATATIIAAIEAGLTPQQAATGLLDFHGAKRRFDTTGREKGVWVVDDYAHHPTEIATTLIAARQTAPTRLICTFQPHRYSRTQLLQKEFGAAFGEADLLVLTDIYAAGEDPIEGVDGTTILNQVTEQTGQKVAYIKERKAVAPYLASIVQDGDLVLTMGAGDIWQTGGELLELLRKQN